uniref:Ubiquitin-like protease family profile domain-containing protein n=1 Tax=Takifugu rubripes TaxID=31033 RepID=A0A3B5JZA7_TAKRU
MYGWIVDGIFSLFEPVTTGKKPTEWSGKGNVSEEASTRPGVKVRSLQQENHARPAKRHYQRSVLSIIVKYICSRCGSDLYLTVTVSTLTCPCLLRAGQSAGYSDRGKDWEKRGSVQLLPSRPALQLGASTEPTCNGIGRNRNYKPSLTVEEVFTVRCVYIYVIFLILTYELIYQKQTTEMDLSTEVAIRLSLVDREASPVSPPGALSAPSRHSEEDIPRLTKEMATAVSRALAQSDPNLVLSAAFKLRITQRDLATLQEGGWLNDEVINFYLSLIMERSTDQAAELKVYSFSTFFFPKLRGGGGGLGGHAQVKRWTKAVDLFSYDLVLVPLHLDVHWALAVIDLKSKTVVSYDSMGHRHDDICKLLLLYLKDEHKAKKGKELDETKWTVGNLRATEAPQQKNGSDCGVFACKYADYIAKERPLTFKQCHMPLFRKLMIWEILNQKLL